jgi:hypothetical protein
MAMMVSHIPKFDVWYLSEARARHDVEAGHTSFLDQNLTVLSAFA